MLDIQIYYEMMGEVTDNLKNEIKELTFKVQKAREDENWKTYKNLILAYKEVIQLYKGIVDKISENTTIDNPTKYINNQMTIGLDEKTTELFTKITSEGYINTNINKDDKKKNSLKVIKLFEDCDFIKAQDYNIIHYDSDKILKVNNDGKKIINMGNYLLFKLDLASQKRELIDITGFRGIGKTATLIEFAKEHDYIVVVKQEDSYLRDIYNYDKIYNQENVLRGIRDIDCVVDEDVNINRVKNELGLNIVTGYINNNTNK